VPVAEHHVRAHRVRCGVYSAGTGGDRDAEGELWARLQGQAKHVDAAASSRLGQMLVCLADHGMAGEGLHQLSLSLSPTRCKHGAACTVWTSCGSTGLRKLRPGTLLNEHVSRTRWCSRTLLRLHHRRGQQANGAASAAPPPRHALCASRRLQTVQNF
jgi:hypothetical protein